MWQHTSCLRSSIPGVHLAGMGGGGGGGLKTNDQETNMHIGRLKFSPISHAHLDSKVLTNFYNTLKFSGVYSFSKKNVLITHHAMRLEASSYTKSHGDRNSSLVECWARCLA